MSTRRAAAHTPVFTACVPTNRFLPGKTLRLGATAQARSARAGLVGLRHGHTRVPARSLGRSPSLLLRKSSDTSSRVELAPPVYVGMTRGYIIFCTREDGILLVIAVAHDAYPEGIGQDLAELLRNLPHEDFSCLAAQAAAALAVELIDSDSENDTDELVVDVNQLLPTEYEALDFGDRDFVYTVRESEDAESRVIIEMSETPFGEEDRSVLTPAAFLQAHGTTDEVTVATLMVELRVCRGALRALPFPDSVQVADLCPSLILMLRNDAREHNEGCLEFLALRLEGMGWADYLADALPRIIGAGITDVASFAALLLVDLKRGPGGVFLAHPLWESQVLSEGGMSVTINCGSVAPLTPVVTLQARMADRRQMGLQMRAQLYEYPRDSGEYLMPTADDLSTVQPAFDAMADCLRLRWSPSTHAHLPAAVRERACELLLVGVALSGRWGDGFLDQWREIVMPEAVSAFEVRRPDPPRPPGSDVEGSEE